MPGSPGRQLFPGHEEDVVSELLVWILVAVEVLLVRVGVAGDAVVVLEASFHIVRQVLGVPEPAAQGPPSFGSFTMMVSWIGFSPGVGLVFA
jgi:hypothetical protein